MSARWLLVSMCLLGGCVLFEPPTALQSTPDAGRDAALTTDASSHVDAPGAPDAWSAAPDAWSAPDANDQDAPMDPPDAWRTCVVASIMTFDTCAGPIVINEVDGSGNDFVEIYNRSDAPVNISNYVITDDNAGSPDVAEGAVIPPGTTLDAHRYIYVWANLTSPQPGLRTDDCIPGAPPPCVHSGWGISASGERVYLLDDALTVLCAFQYPSSVFGGEAFGRVGDGSDVLCPTLPTPGEANVASTMR